MLSRRSNLAELDGRDLQSIDSSWLTPETTAQLDARHSLGGWNQFEANKKLYNFQDTYDENIYTKRLDRSQLTREQLERADLLANQIESSTTTNFHLREERGQISTGEEENYDEEDRYSGVLRQHSPGGNSRPGSKPKSSPTSAGGSWRRVNVPAPSNSSPGPAWGQKPSYAAAAGKNTQPNPKADPSLPPGFGAAPPAEGGYFKSNIDVANIEPNISFYGTSPEAPVAPTETVPIETEAPIEVIPSTSPGKEPEIISPPITESVTVPDPVDKAPTPSLETKSDTLSTGNPTPNEVGKPGTPVETSSATAGSVLRATAAEWKPPSSSTTSSPNPTTTATPTPTPVTQGQGNSGGGNSNNYSQRPNNRSKGRNSNNSHYRNGGGNNYHQVANPNYEMYPPMPAYYDPMYPPAYQDMGVFIPYDPATGYFAPFFPPPFDPSYPMFPVYPDQQMMTSFPTELVGMDHANHGVSVAPGLSDMGMKGNNEPHNNEGN